MRVQELIDRLENYRELNPYIYINREANWEDNFQVQLADTGNLLLIPNAEYEFLSKNQEFYFVKD